MKSATSFGIGASLPRKEDDRHLRGRGQFVSDIRMPGIREVVFVRSPHANARIRKITVAPEADGRVFTAADLPRITPIRVVNQSPGARSPAWPPLATAKARYVGEAIAACVGSTREEAEDLAGLVTIDFEPLAAVVDAASQARGRRSGARALGRQRLSSNARSKAATSRRRALPPPIPS